jgi:hypothetical protein
MITTAMMEDPLNLSDEEKRSQETTEDEHVSQADSDRESLLAAKRTSEPSGKADGSDILSETVKDGSKGVGLYATITIALCMVSCSFLLLYQFDANAAKIMEAAPSGQPPADYSIPKYESQDFCGATADRSRRLPLGQHILQYQIHVIQNLVHAALLGASAMVAALRGDAIGLYFVRNVAFFCIPIGVIYTWVDLRSVWMGETEPMDHIFRLPLAFTMAVAGVVAFLEYTPIFARIRWILSERARCDFRDNQCNLLYPKGLAANAVEANLARLIYAFGNIVQALAWIHYGVTTWQWLANAPSGCDLNASQGTRVPMMTDLQIFEMSFSGGAHQSLLIALFFLAATYPRDMASVGGSLLSSGWRLLVALGSLLNLLNHPGGTTTRIALINTAVEALVMTPIVMASLFLALRIVRRPRGNSVNQRDKEVESPVVANSASDERGSSAKDDVSLVSEDQYRCPSLFQIARSKRYTKVQRRGARLLGYGTFLLLLEMSAECFVLLRQNHMGTTMTQEIYRWGMHVSAMYIFCAVMCVETPFVYQTTRGLLAAACPSGSLVALWQLSTLLRYSTDLHDNVFDQVVAGLLCLRVVSGFFQTIGLAILEHLEPMESSTDHPRIPSEQTTIVSRLVLLRRFLVGVYMPSMVMYIFYFALLGNCAIPMVSPSLSDAACKTHSSLGFSLAQNWPGMGLFFHYGAYVAAPFIYLSSTLAVLPFPSLHPRHTDIYVRFQRISGGHSEVQARSWYRLPLFNSCVPPHCGRSGLGRASD